MGLTQNTTFRDIGFDTARGLCMIYIVGILHLSGYIGEAVSVFGRYYVCHQPTWNIWMMIMDACLGLFSFISGWFIGGKYVFEKGSSELIKTFYKKRLIRVYPLFFVASITLFLIGINAKRATFYGLIGLSPFVVVRPLTLWYIAVIMICYLITPFVNRISLKYKLINSTIAFGTVLLLYALLGTVDERFIYNIGIYLLGLILSSQQLREYFVRWISNIYIMFALCVVWSIAGIVCVHYGFAWKTLYWYLSVVWGIFVILSISIQLAKISNKWFRKIIKYVSYASMACYMFHRLFFWIGQKCLYLFDTYIHTYIHTGRLWAMHCIPVMYSMLLLDSERI